MLSFLDNIGEYFAANYFDENFIREVLDRSGYDAAGHKVNAARLRPLREQYYQYKQEYLRNPNARRKDLIAQTHEWHDRLLAALDYPVGEDAYTFQPCGKDGVVPVRSVIRDAAGEPVLFVMEMRSLIHKSDEDQPEGLFEQRYDRQSWDRVFSVPEEAKLTPSVVNEAVSEIFLLDQAERPEYILLLAGNEAYLLHYEKWFRGSYLRFDLEQFFATANAERHHYPVLYALLCRRSLAPDGDVALLDRLNEESHKKAQAVTQDLQEGVILAVEALANEVIYSLRQEWQTEVQIDPAKLTEDCLTIVYRLLFLFYAESREELDLVPLNDATYRRGYSLEMLRDLEQVRLNSEESRNGYFFHESLTRLFGLLFRGHRGGSGSRGSSFTVQRLDSPLFDDERLHLFPKAKIRNWRWQEIIRRLSLSKRTHGRGRGRISYANLDINQLGSVYEGLLSYRGIFAKEDLIEVHKKNKPEEGTYLTPRSRMGEYNFKTEVLKRRDAEGRATNEPLVHPAGSFVYRLSGRDREKSASYYTPEVLTRTVVYYTLEPFRRRLAAGELTARELMQLRILEPAMGAAAFHNEVINQLSELYLEYRQRELNRRINPNAFREERQRVKAALAANNVYGVDLDEKAIELGKLALWLNGIHREMETPFFGHRLGRGNAVIGCWLKVYAKKQFLLTAKSENQKKRDKKEWWKKAPRPLDPTRAGLGRKAEEIYHFLLPDANMVPSADHKQLKKEYPDACKYVKEWRKEFCRPIEQAEFNLLQRLSDRIDALLEEHYQVQRQIESCTRGNLDYFGAYDDGENCELNLSQYAEKERLQQQRQRDEAPYARLKLAMDYWCALWCWDVRHAADLPTRHNYLLDLSNILEPDRPATETLTELTAGPAQTDLFRASQLSLGRDARDAAVTVTVDRVQRYGDRANLFGDEVRLLRVTNLTERMRFFHYQLEFFEVFRERGGFDVAVGNPPWLKIQFDEQGVIGEAHPIVLVRKHSASRVRKKLPTYLQDPALARTYYDELVANENAANFMNAPQNYPLLKGQQTNLYKCIVENGFQWINPSGYLGLLHPEGLYDDPKGKAMRREMYQRLRYHFHFRNQLMLFAEIGHRVDYGIHIYKGTKDQPSFYSIHNLFDPATITPSFTHDGSGTAGGVKRITTDENFEWNLEPHRDRIVHITPEELAIFAHAFENSQDWKAAKLVSIHAQSIVNILRKLSEFPTKVGDYNPLPSEGFHETNAQDKGWIRRETRYPDPEQYELIYSGPHFFVGTPYYKTPRSVCEQKSDYDVIDLTTLPTDYVPRTNYVPAEDPLTFAGRINGLRQTGTDAQGKPVYDRWVDYFKLCFSKMLSISGERTLQPAIIPPKVSHTNAVFSLIFKNSSEVVEAAGICSSVILDFYVKTIGRGNLYDATTVNFPIGLPEHYLLPLTLLTLRLNCLTAPYASLWAELWRDDFRSQDWARDDDRLSPHAALGPEWMWDTPLRNYFERRQALVEIDVLVAQALGLTLAELVLIYEVQFPVLQQNELDTWYDARGQIVFTCSRGLTGVGLDRKEWNTIRDLSAGETYVHTIDPAKSELYGGQEVTYYAPFERCDRVADYERAWAYWAARLEEGTE